MAGTWIIMPPSSMIGSERCGFLVIVIPPVTSGAWSGEPDALAPGGIDYCL
jgi:hypothetical protein